MPKIGRPITLPNTARAREARAASKRWYKKNKKRVKRIGAARLLRDGDKIRERDRLRRLLVRMEAIRVLGGQCSCCGESRWEFLAIDHINNDGAHERRILGHGGTRTAQIVKAMRFPRKRYQLLCHNCNQALEFYGYCPHRQQGKPIRNSKPLTLHAESYEEVSSLVQKRGRRRLTMSAKDEIRLALSNGATVSALSRKYKISRERVRSIRDGVEAPF